MNEDTRVPLMDDGVETPSDPEMDEFGDDEEEEAE